MASHTNDNRTARLTCLRVRRDHDYADRVVVVVFSRPISDNELSFFRETCERSAPLMEDR